jgi:hypothetical protein
MTRIGHVDSNAYAPQPHPRTLPILRHSTLSRLLIVLLPVYILSLLPPAWRTAYDSGFHDFTSFFFVTTRSCTAYIARILGSLGRYPSGKRYLCFAALGGPESAISPFTLLFASISSSWTCLGVGIYSRALGHFVAFAFALCSGFDVSFGTRMR